jgi:hypothetical protein
MPLLAGRICDAMTLEKHTQREKQSADDGHTSREKRLKEKD